MIGPSALTWKYNEQMDKFYIKILYIQVLSSPQTPSDLQCDLLLVLPARGIRV